MLTYSDRLPLLYKFVRHYSQCASVSEVLIVWNSGEVCVPLGVLDACELARCAIYCSNDASLKIEEARPTPVGCPAQAPTAQSFHSRVPVRIRVEAHNSLNNRFAPDARIHTRAVLSLDDDIFMPCSDIGIVHRHLCISIMALHVP